MKYEFIMEERGQYPLRLLCRTLAVSRSGYYRHLRRPSEGNRSSANRELVTEIRAIVATHARRYGSPRVTAELKRRGRRCSRNRVARLMHSYDLLARVKKRYRITTRQDRRHIPSPNIVAQQFHAGEPNQKWLSDITYIATAEGWMFLTVVMDLASRRVVGRSLCLSLEQETTLRAMRQALGRRKPENGLIVHSDRGSQYTSHAFRQLLAEHGIHQSMSGTGNCYDNAPMESFFKTLKRELVDWQNYQTRDQAAKSIIEYIELYYNNERLHSALGYKTPNEWEENVRKKQLSTINQITPMSVY